MRLLQKKLLATVVDLFTIFLKVAPGSTATAYSGLGSGFTGDNLQRAVDEMRNKKKKNCLRSLPGHSFASGNVLYISIASFQKKYHCLLIFFFLFTFCYTPSADLPLITKSRNTRFSFTSCNSFSFCKLFSST